MNYLFCTFPPLSISAALGGGGTSRFYNASLLMERSIHENSHVMMERISEGSVTPRAVDGEYWRRL